MSQPRKHPRNTLRPNNPSNTPIKEHQKTYSDAIRSGLQTKHPHMEVVAFEAMWLNAKPPPIPINNFPHRIEGVTPSVWHTQYKKKAIIPMTLLSHVFFATG